VVNFPRQKVDVTFDAWPEADLWFIASGPVNHIAYTPNKFTKSFAPFFNWRYDEQNPFLLDAEERILIFKYYNTKLGVTGRHYVFYNYKQDKVLYETPLDEDDQIRYSGYLDDGVLLGSAPEVKDDAKSIKCFIYDWRTGTRTENELTEKITELRLMVSVNRGLNREKRFLIAERGLGEAVKVDWDENYEEVQVTPLKPLLPKGKIYMDLLLSFDGRWLFSILGPYEGLYRERLYKRAFYHIDSRYPGGVSFPVIVDYTDESVEWGVFVEHPVHGMCYAVEYHKEENGKDQLYLRLYTMDSVLDEINRYIK
jgi:hypothetical protein